MADNPVERPEDDIYYDLNPFVAAYQCKCGRIKNHKGFVCEFCNSLCVYTGDMNARYKGEVQNQLVRERFFNGINQDYYNAVLNSVRNVPKLYEIYFYSRFLRNYLPEIANRLCLECDFVRDVEEHPENYIAYSYDELKKPINDFLYWLFNICRFGKKTVEKMIDTVEQEKIDEFLELFSDNCTSLLLLYIIEHQPS